MILDLSYRAAYWQTLLVLAWYLGQTMIDSTDFGLLCILFGGLLSTMDNLGCISHYLNLGMVFLWTDGETGSTRNDGTGSIGSTIKQAHQIYDYTVGPLDPFYPEYITTLPSTPL
ncbi:unnamed protein product [Absidia cylindrospora]